VRIYGPGYSVIVVGVVVAYFIKKAAEMVWSVRVRKPDGTEAAYEVRPSQVTVVDKNDALASAAPGGALPEVVPYGNFSGSRPAYDDSDS
jgi:hypothetical protein